MPAFNFKKEFAAKVKSGEKKSTIRLHQRGRPGDPAYLYTGQRTRQCEKLGESTLIFVAEIIIDHDDCGKPSILIGGKKLTGAKREKLAIDEGFQDQSEMFAWIEKQYGLPFQGYIHVWE